MSLEGNDELLVNRSGTTYTLEQQNLMAEIQDTDLLLVNRSGTTYTATGQELIDSVIPDLELIVTFAPNVAYIDQILTAVPVVSGGVEPTDGYVYSYQWIKASDIEGSDQSNIVGESAGSFVPTEDLKGMFIGCIVQTTDDRGTIAQNNALIGPVDYKPATEPPVINSVVLTQDQVNDKRFAGNAFTTTVDATNRPNQLALEAEVVGALSLDAGTDLISEIDGNTLKFVGNTNLDGVVFEVGDQVQQDSSVDFTSSEVNAVGTNIDNFTTFYSARSTTTFDFSDYNSGAVVSLMKVNNGSSGGGGGGAGSNRGGEGGGGGQQGMIFGYTSTVGTTPNWTTNSSTAGWTQLITLDPGQFSNADPGATGLPGNIPAADPWLDLFAPYFTMLQGQGGGGGRHGSGSAGAGYGGNGGNGGVAFSRVSSPFAAQIGDGESDDLYIFTAPTASSGTRNSNDGINGGPGGSGGRGYGAGGGGGGGESRVGDTNSGAGSGGQGAPGISFAAVTGTRFFNTAFKFTNSNDVQSIHVGDTFVASSGATGTVVSVDLTNAAVLLDVESGSVTLSNTITFSSTIGKGTIDSIDALATPPELTLSGKTGSFSVGRYLIHQTPKAIKITPRSEVISSVNADTTVLTLVGNDQLIEFANGDPVTMCDANGDSVIAEIETSDIVAYAQGDLLNYTSTITSATGQINNPGNAFDGNTGTNVSAGSTGSGEANAKYLTFNFDQVVSSIEASSLELHCDVDPYPSNEGAPKLQMAWRYMRANGTWSGYETLGPGGGRNSWHTLSSGPITFKKLDFKGWFDGGSNGVCIISAVRINGNKILTDNVDRGNPTLTFANEVNLSFFKDGDVVQDRNPWNQSENWTQGTFTEPTYNDTSRQPFFDGDLTNQFTSNGNAEQVQLRDIDVRVTSMVTLIHRDNENFDTASDTTFVSVVRQDNGANTNYAMTNAGANKPSRTGTFNGLGVKFYDFPVDVPGDLSQVVFRGSNSSGRTYLSGIMVDGKLLVDNDIVNPNPVKIAGTPQTSPPRVNVTGGEWHVKDSSTENLDKPWGDYIEFGTYDGWIAQPGINAFDGDFNTRPTSENNGSNADATSGKVFFRPEGGLPFVVLEAYVTDPLFNKTITVNGSPITTPSTAGWFTLSQNGNLVEIATARGGSNGGIFFPALRVDGKILLDTRAVGDTKLEKTAGGTGIVDSVDLENNTMTLSTTNNEWLAGYYVCTPEKNAVEMRAYLTFDSEGNNLDLSHFGSDPILMDDVVSPTLTFPTTFSTGEGVDTDLPYPTYLETYVKVSNSIGDSTKVSSGQFFPQTTVTRTIPAASSYRVMTDEFGDYCYWACSSDYRAAIKTIQDAEQTVQQLRVKAETMASDFLARDDVY